MANAETLRDALSFIPSCDRDVWVKMGMAVKSELGDEGLPIWEAWSEQDESYDPKAARDVWGSIRSGRVGVGSLFHEAKRHGWQGNADRPVPDHTEIIERERKAQEADEERTQAHQEASSKALQIWKAAGSVTDHPYLGRKQLKPTGTLREIPQAAAARILGYSPKAKGELLAGRLLVVPVKVSDTLSTLELIDETGRKSALAGGRKSGGYWATQPLDDVQTLLIGEGVATILSATVATEQPGVAALSCGNLQAVAKAMRDRYPSAQLVILADIGPGQDHAEMAALAVGGYLAVPNFGLDRPDDATDFNDLHKVCGLDTVRHCINTVLSTQQTKPDASHGDRARTQWPTPQPLVTIGQCEPYPIDALPDMIRAAVTEVQGFTKAPIPLVVSSALGALSLVLQAHYDAQRAERLAGPVGLYLLTIADSGERKSTVDGFFTQAIRDYEDSEAEAAKPLIADSKASSEAWEAKRLGIKDKLRQLAKEDKPTFEAEAALRRLEDDKPEAPRVPRLLYNDATPEALGYSLAYKWPSGGIVSAEAGSVFGGHSMGKDSIMRTLSLLNVLWDGGSTRIDRRTSDSFTVKGARLTASLQVQAPTLRDFLARNGDLARGSGFLARFLIAWPESTQGTRAYTEAPANWPALGIFNRRMATLLSQPVPITQEGTLEPSQLTLSPEAKDLWIAFHDMIESELANGGELQTVKDVASKVADNAVRMAALFHVFGGDVGPISAEAFTAASWIVTWHLNESKRFFGELALPQELADAGRLDAWLIEQCRKGVTHQVATRDAQRLGPVRDKQRLATALQELGELDRVRVVQETRRKIITVNPALLEGKPWV